MMLAQATSICRNVCAAKAKRFDMVEFGPRRNPAFCLALNAQRLGSTVVSADTLQCSTAYTLNHGFV